MACRRRTSDEGFIRNLNPQCFAHADSSRSADEGSALAAARPTPRPPLPPWDHGRGMGLGTCTAARQWQEMTIQQKNTPWSVLLRSPHEHRPSLLILPCRCVPRLPSPRRRTATPPPAPPSLPNAPPGLPASPPLALSPAAPPSERTASPPPPPSHRRSGEYRRPRRYRRYRRSRLNQSAQRPSPTMPSGSRQRRGSTPGCASASALDPRISAPPLAACNRKPGGLPRR